MVKEYKESCVFDFVFQVRAAAAYALHTLFAVPNLPPRRIGPDGDPLPYTQDELRVADILMYKDLWLAQEMSRRAHESPLVRMEVILSISALVFNDFVRFFQVSFNTR